MARRAQDIPIRPRYGLPDESNVDTDEENKVEQLQQISTTPPPKPKSKEIVSMNESTGSNSEQIASSYSEIPFLSQYAGSVPDHAYSDVTPTGVMLPPSRGDSLEDEEEHGDFEAEDYKRPNSLECDSFPYKLECDTTTTSSIENKMHHFVADNLEEQLRAGSPMSKRDQLGYVSQGSTALTTGLLTRHFVQTQLPQIDANVLSDIEIETQYLAASLDNLTENLCSLLHSISSITADNVEVHKNAVNKLTDSMDANIKCMYTIMAKTEEITKSMKPTEQLGLRIREIKRLVDMLDNTM